jgi:hypothetical protein
MLNGPRCNGRPETAHHTKPTSQFPELFFDVRFIVAACKPCNYGDGAVIRATNRDTRMLVAHLEQVIKDQQAEIAELVATLARYESGEPKRKRAKPAIR